MGRPVHCAVVFVLLVATSCSPSSSETTTSSNPAVAETTTTVAGAAVPETTTTSLVTTTTSVLQSEWEHPWAGVEFTAMSDFFSSEAGGSTDSHGPLMNAENFHDTQIVIDGEPIGLWVWFVGWYLCRGSGMAPCVDLVIVGDEPNPYEAFEAFSDEPNPDASHELIAWAVQPVGEGHPYPVDSYLITDSVRLIRSGTDPTDGSLVQGHWCDPEHHSAGQPDLDLTELPEGIEDVRRLYAFVNAPPDVEDQELLPASLAMTIIDGEIVLIDNDFIRCWRYLGGL